MNGVLGALRDGVPSGTRCGVVLVMVGCDGFRPAAPPNECVRANVIGFESAE